MIVEVRFEVADEDPGVYTWQEAVDHLAKRGDGWRLPSGDELGMMYEKRDVIGGFKPDWYWGAEYSTSTGHGIDFSDGERSDRRKINTLRVRAVRDV